MTILEVMKDINLFGPWFAGDSWTAWRVLLAGLFGLPMTPGQLEIYKRHTETRRSQWILVDMIPTLIAK